MVGQVPEALDEAIRDLCWRATPCGTDATGAVNKYLLTAGTLHRLIGIAQGVGIAAVFRDGVPARIESTDGVMGQDEKCPVCRHRAHEWTCQNTAVIDACGCPGEPARRLYCRVCDAYGDHLSTHPHPRPER